MSKSEVNGKRNGTISDNKWTKVRSISDPCNEHPAVACGLLWRGVGLAGGYFGGEWGECTMGAGVRNWAELALGSYTGINQRTTLFSQWSYLIN